MTVSSFGHGSHLADSSLSEMARSSLLGMAVSSRLGIAEFLFSSGNGGLLYRCGIRLGMAGF